MEEISQKKSFTPLIAQCRLLLLRLLLAMLVYTLCRSIFYLYNKDLLDIASGQDLLRIFIGGLRFDLSAVLYSSLLLTALSLAPLGVAYSKG